MSDQASRGDLSDDDMLRLLGAALDEHEPIPEQALLAAYGAADMDLLSEELAALVFDSAGTGGALVGMRGPEAETRLLSFVNDHVSIDLELHADGTTVVGQVMPTTDAVLQVDVEDGATIDVGTDEFGRFRFVAPVGAIRLRLVGVVVTPWITR